MYGFASRAIGYMDACVGITQTNAAKTEVEAAQAVSFCKDMALPFSHVLVSPRREFAGSPPNVPSVAIVPRRR
jgi:hypothetical protein